MGYEMLVEYGIALTAYTNHVIDCLCKKTEPIRGHLTGGESYWPEFDGATILPV